MNENGGKNNNGENLTVSGDLHEHKNAIVYFLPCCHREINFNYLQLFQLNSDCEDPKKTAVKINSSLVLMFDATPAGRKL